MGDPEANEVGLMLGILIADQDVECRKQMAELLIEAGYNVIVSNSAADALDGILKKSVQVVLLGNEFDKLKAAEIVPILKQCNRDLTIILISAETSLPLLRKLRNEGIFYHALKPTSGEDKEEIRKAVKCAFESLKQGQTK